MRVTFITLRTATVVAWRQQGITNEENASWLRAIAKLGKEKFGAVAMERRGRIRKRRSDWDVTRDA
jgi:hypothetical protein